LSSKVDSLRGEAQVEGKKRRDEEERRKVIEERELRVLVALV
jgi:hypothetical protein